MDSRGNCDRRSNVSAVQVDPSPRLIYVTDVRLRARHAFLGFTDNHIKSGRVIFFREDATWTVPKLLSECGDLNSVFVESGYGKYCARLGLSFSSTALSLHVSCLMTFY